MFLFSIIIPTWKKSHTLLATLDAIKKQKKFSGALEILVCGETKNINLKYIKNLNKFISTRFINIKENSISKKRNKGIKHAIGKNLIFLDDDSIIDHNYFINCKKNINSRSIFYCGKITYNNQNLNNYQRFKHSVHKKYNTIKNLKAKNIVTMNMIVNRKLIVENKLYFNETFKGYGLEDYEFGYRVIQKGFKIKSINANIIHNEDNKTFESFLNKIFILSKNAMPVLIDQNYAAAKMINFYKFENFYLIKKLIKFKYTIFFLKILIKILIFFEDKIYFKNLYYIGIYLSYLKGTLYRNK